MSEVKNQINALLKEAQAKISEAEALADKSGEGFNWGGPAYGMGGWYNPEPSEKYEDSDGYYDSDEYGWQASSQSC